MAFGKPFNFYMFLFPHLKSNSVVGSLFFFNTAQSISTVYGMWQKPIKCQPLLLCTKFWMKDFMDTH